MTDRTHWESIKVEGEHLVDRVKELIDEGNVQRLVIRVGTRTIAEFPLAPGEIGAEIAPMLAAVGAISALVIDCSIDVERTPETTGEMTVESVGDAGEVIDM